VRSDRQEASRGRSPRQGERRESRKAERPDSLKPTVVREEERTRIARELHDEIGQVLTGIKFSLERTLLDPASDVKAGIAQALELTTELIGRVRDLALDLRPAMLDDLGLLAAFTWHFQRYTSQVNVDVDFEHHGLERRRFPAEVETAAYRIVQEALTNVARYAGARRVEVSVEANEHTLSIKVRDEGSGFDPQTVEKTITSGLSGMRERAVMLGGIVTIRSARGGGAAVVARLPLRPRRSRSRALRNKARQRAE